MVHLSNNIYGLKEENDVAAFLAQCQIHHSVPCERILYKLSLIKCKLPRLYIPPNILLQYI